MPICFHVVPDPAGEQQQGEGVDLGVETSRCVTPSSSLRAVTWTSTLIGSSRGSARRAATIGATIAMISAGRLIAARRSSACHAQRDANCR